MSEPIRVMHFADTHFGVEQYGRLDPATGMHSRLEDFRDTLLEAIGMALDRGVQLAVFAGDAYKSRDPSQTHQREFARCLRELTGQGVPVVLLTGNHDMPNVRGRANALEIYRTLGVQGVEILSQPDVRIVQTAGGPVQIAALPYLMRGILLAKEELEGKDADEVRQALVERYGQWIRDLAARCDTTLPTILLGHFWVSSARLSTWQQGYLSTTEPQVQVSEAANDAFDYVALGHIHRHQDLNRGAYPPVVYAGSPIQIDFGEREEPKGFVMVNLVRGATTYSFVEVPPKRRLVDLDVNARGEDPTSEILAAIREAQPKDAVVRLTYTVRHETSQLVDRKALREALSTAFMVVAIHGKVDRPDSIRTRALTESLSPLDALRQHLALSNMEQGRAELLVQRAEVLYAELLAGKEPDRA